MKKFILSLFLLVSIISYSQSWNLSAQQDPSLLFNGDGQTSKSSTTNLLVKTSYDFDSYNKNRVAYWSFILGFEFADLRKTYQRYTTGFNYNLKLNKRLIGTVGYDFGITYRGTNYERDSRPPINYITQSVNSNLEFKLNKSFTVIATAQLVDRRDYYFYSKTKYGSKLIFSTFVGIKYKIL